VTDRDEAFAVEVRATSGASFFLSMGSEHAAHDLATTLVPAHDRTRVVFEGVAPTRSMETAAVGMVGLAVVGALMAALLGAHFNPFAPFVSASASKAQFDFAYWVEWAGTFIGPLVAGYVAVAFARALARRIAPGRVALDARAVATDLVRYEYEEIESVEPEDTSVSLLLHDGNRVRLAFGHDRPIVELDRFVARVRAGMAGTIVATHPAAESSGVRVALEETEQVDEIDEDAPAKKRMAR
jgi:hypothetical protein